MIIGAGKFDPDETVGFCGAEARAGAIQGYFEGIRRDASSGDLGRFAKYYADRVIIGYRGKTYARTRFQLARSTSLRLTLRDWKAIGELSKTQLGSGGWRGCFVSDGKAFFSIQHNGQLKLVDFDKDRPWPN